MYKTSQCAAHLGTLCYQLMLRARECLSSSVAGQLGEETKDLQLHLLR